jgi:hypothetical protein
MLVGSAGERAASFLHVSNATLDVRSVRVHQHGYHPGLGYQIGQQLDPLGHQLDED